MKHMNKIFGHTYRSPDPDPADPGPASGDPKPDPDPDPKPDPDPDPKPDPDPDPDPKPSDKEKELLGEVMKKKEKIGTLSGEVAALKEAAKVWEGIDLTAVKEMIQTNKDADEAALIAAGEFTQVKDQMNAAHAEIITGKDAIIADLNTALAGKDTEIDNLSIGNTFSASKFIQEKLTLPATKARTLYGAHFDRDESGNVIGYNKPAGAEGRAPLVDGNGVNLAFDAAFQKIVDSDPDKKSLYRSTVKPGAGSKTDPLGGPADPDPNVGSGASRIAAGLADGMLKDAKGLKLSSD